MSEQFSATKHPVLNRGIPPDEFLYAIVDWARHAPMSIFQKNLFHDIYAVIAETLGPWTSDGHRRATMLEVMRVHAGFESSWNWDEGVDRRNASSLSDIRGQETGVFQVSFDSTALAGSAMMGYARENGIETPQKFIPAMKSNHWLAIDYYARLIRVNIKWAGPIVRGEILPWLRRDAVAEFQATLAMCSNDTAN